VDLKNNTVLVTGGGSGIGLAIAQRFLEAGSVVVACGRRERMLRAVQEQNPGLQISACDLSDESNRRELVRWITSSFPKLNVLVNNAGIQRRLRLDESEPWGVTHEEIAINLEAAIHLTRLLVPHLLTRERPAIVNITSGLAFVPLAAVPVYCATKAALHSYTLSLRHQLHETPIRVLEVIPPAVDTDLGGPGLHTFGVYVDEFADAVFDGLRSEQLEITYGYAKLAAQASADERSAIFERMNNNPNRE